MRSSGWVSATSCGHVWTLRWLRSSALHGPARGSGARCDERSSGGFLTRTFTLRRQITSRSSPYFTAHATRSGGRNVVEVDSAGTRRGCEPFHQVGPQRSRDSVRTPLTRRRSASCHGVMLPQRATAVCLGTVRRITGQRDTKVVGPFSEICHSLDGRPGAGRGRHRFAVPKDKVVSTDFLGPMMHPEGLEPLARLVRSMGLRRLPGWTRIEIVGCGRSGWGEFGGVGAVSTHL